MKEQIKSLDDLVGRTVQGVRETERGDSANRDLLIEFDAGFVILVAEPYYKGKDWAVKVETQAMPPSWLLLYDLITRDEYEALEDERRADLAEYHRLKQKLGIEDAGDET